jgi:hypothetical protein
VPYADKVIDFIDQNSNVAHARLPYVDAAREVHAGLADVENMIDFLRTYQNRVRMMLRPPYARLRELQEKPDPTPDPSRLRDARNRRDNAQDMRMPPYMRSDTASALSLTRRQYNEIMQLLDYLNVTQAQQPSVADALAAKATEEPSIAQPAPEHVNTALRQHIERVVTRFRERQHDEPEQ